MPHSDCSSDWGRPHAGGIKVMTRTSLKFYGFQLIAKDSTSFPVVPLHPRVPSHWPGRHLIFKNSTLFHWFHTTSKDPTSFCTTPPHFQLLPFIPKDSTSYPRTSPNYQGSHFIAKDSTSFLRISLCFYWVHITFKMHLHGYTLHCIHNNSSGEFFKAHALFLCIFSSVSHTIFYTIVFFYIY